MPRTPTTGRPAALLPAAFLALSAALATALLAVRNLYDDEILSFDLLPLSFRSLIRFSSGGDIHPPGMYLLAHLAWLLIPSFRWLNLIPAAVFYTGLAVFVLEIAPLLRTPRARLCFLLLATLHPQLFLWNATFRWYSWWTGLALITLTVTLQPRAPRPTLTVRRALTLSLLLAALFYLNYITLLFALALAGAMLLRYRTLPRAQILTRALATLTLTLLLIVPQLRTMLLVHLPDSRAQRSAPLFATVRLLQSIATSEAYLPWHPLAILATLIFVGLCITAALSFLRSRTNAHSPAPHSAQAAFLLFGLVFFLLVAASGLGGKPRNALLLIPIAAFAAALLLDTLRPHLQTATLLCFTLWIAIGLTHLFGRSGLAKASMNNHPEQVIAFLRAQHTADPAACSIAITYDSGLAFALAQANLPRTLLLSPYRGPLFADQLALPPTGCDRTVLYGIQSYLGGTPRRIQTFQGQLAAAGQFIQGPPAIQAFSPDRDAPTKRRLARIPALASALGDAATLPDHRYVVTFGPIAAADLTRMRAQLPAFFSSPAQPNPRAADADTNP